MVVIPNPTALEVWELDVTSVDLIHEIREAGSPVRKVLPIVHTITDVTVLQQKGGVRR